MTRGPLQLLRRSRSTWVEHGSRCCSSTILLLPHRVVQVNGPSACSTQRQSTLSKRIPLGKATSSRLPSRCQAHMHHPAVRRTYAHSTNNNSEVGVSYTVEDRSPESKVATITVRNPKKMNIVDSRILQDLIAVCIELAQIPSLRAVVLTGGTIAPGKSPAFIGGADIKEMHALASSSDARTFITKVHHACRALRDLPVPVIARIHGFCLGAGLEIMAACDLRIATESSIFGMPEVKVGIPSVVEAALLPGLLGMGRTRRLLYLAENISATEAEKWGLIEKLVPHDDDDEGALDKAVDEWVETLICMGPRAIRSQKRLMQKWESCTLDEGVEAGVEAFAEAYENGGREPREYMSKF